MDFQALEKPIGIIASVVTIATGLIPQQYSLVSLSLIVVGTLGIGFFGYRGYKKPYTVRFISRTIQLDFPSKNPASASQTRFGRLRALKQNTSYFDEHMSTDGTFDAIRVSGGTVEQTIIEGGDLFLRIGLTRPLKKGEEIEVEMKCDLINSFKNESKEYWSVRVSHPTEIVRLVIRFHPEKPYKNFRGYDRITTHEMLAKTQPAESIIDGKPALIWEIEKPEIGHVYKLTWSW